MLRSDRADRVARDRSSGLNLNLKGTYLVAQAGSGDTVRVHYTGTFDDGEVFDTSSGRDPLEFKIGSGQLIPGFDAAVDGMSPGESKTVNIPAEEAYGPHRDEMVLEVDRDQVPPDLDPKVGERLEIKQQDGRSVPVTVTAVTDAQVILDGNHPLAGKALNFEIELVEII
jgi:peptidylprolyl isomerase